MKHLQHMDKEAREAAQFFRQLIEQDPKGARDQFLEVKERMRESKLLVGEEVAPFCFAPAMISSSRYGMIKRDILSLLAVLKRLEPMLLRPRWLNRLRISEAEQDLIRLPAGFELGLFVSRVDGFMGTPISATDSGFRVVELNVDSPGGAAYLDTASEMLGMTPIWQKFRASVPGYMPRSCQRILKTLLRAWHLWGGLNKPRVGIVDWVTVSTASEFDVLKREFESQGISTVVCDPRELEFSNGHLKDYDGNRIDLVYRRVLVEDLLSHGAEARALLDAYRAGAVCLVNPFRSKPLTVKSLMAVFHDPEMAELLDPEQLELVRRLVPWTALVEDGPVVETILKDKESLVLKPADSWGGQGVYLGWQSTPSEWENGLKEALKGHYIVQRRISIPSQTFPILDGEEWDFREFRWDLNPFSFGQSVGRPLVRIANNDLLNIKAGGRLCVTYQLGLSTI